MFCVAISLEFCISILNCVEKGQVVSNKRLTLPKLSFGLSSKVGR